MTERASGPAPGGAEPEAGWAPGDRVRLVFDSVLLAVGVGYLVLALELEVWTERGPREGLFPLAAGGLFVLCMGIETIVTSARLARSPRRNTGAFEWRIAIVLAAVVWYVVVVGVIGHLLTAFVLVGVLLRLFARRAWWQTALAAAIAALVSDYLFSELLGFKLPSGLFQIGFESWI